MPMVTLVKPLQPKNARLPMEVTELGMVTVVKLLQLSNTELPMEVTELGTVTLVKSRQPENAELPMKVTELGMVTEVIFEPFAKYKGSTSTSLPIVTRSKLEVTISPLVEQFRAFQIMSVNPLQP